MMLNANEQLIPAPMGVLEIDSFWQENDPLSSATQRVALLCHPNPLAQGTMNNKVVTTLYRFARDHGMHVVRFNFRGVGKSTGSYGNVVGEIDDALTVLQWLHQTTNARQLWLGGFSFGGFVIAKLAQMIMEQGAFLGLDDFEITDLALIAPSIEKHPLNDLRLPTNQTFMIYGQQDEIISSLALKNFADCFGIRQRVIADTGHFFHGQLVTLKQILMEETSQS